MTTTNQRRDEILSAALTCFTEAGYERASIAGICRASGASVGSVYHHFGDKEGVAAAVYAEGVRRYQAGLLEILATGADSDPGAVISQLVEYHIHRVREQPDWARFLFMAGSVPRGAVERSSVPAENARLLKRLSLWIGRHAAGGRLVAMDAGVFLAVTLGPSHELARRWLGGDASIDLDRLAPELGAAARRAVGAIASDGEV